MISFSPEEIEGARLEALADILAEKDGEERLSHNEPGSFGYHEALDRSSQVLNILDNSLMEHPAIVSDSEAFRLAHEAHTAIFNLYQHLGAKHL